ncbi:oxygenase MpaB family protein [soil metagenome]
MIPTRFVDSAAARREHGDRVARLAPWLLAVDPLADAVVRDVMRGMPPGRGWAQIERILREGIAQVPDAHPSARALFESVERVPAWVDWKTIDHTGALLLRTGYFGGLVLGIQSLPYGYASPGGNKPLAFSGRLRQQAPRRLTETARFVHTVCLPGELRPLREGFAITIKVRLMHAQVRRLLWDSGKWNTEAWGEPINQHDMAATTMLFSIVVLDGIRKLGFRVSRDEAEDYVQLWRYVGWLMGSTEELLPTSEREAHRLASLIMATQGPPDEDARALTKALMDSGRQAARNDDELRQYERLKHFTRAVSWRLLCDELAASLGVPKSPAEPLFPLLRGIVSAAERVRELSPRFRAMAVKQGDVYWQRLIDQGLRGKPVEFQPPTKLVNIAP